MGTIPVDQLLPDGSVILAADRTMSAGEKNQRLLDALPGAVVESVSGKTVIRYRDQLVLRAQVTHLGRPWEGFKKRIQIPRGWLDVYAEGVAAGLVVRFVGIYQHGDVCIFVDFDPVTYVTRKANNSAAHVATNDLYQAQTLGVFAREDSRRNHLTSVRHDLFERHLLGTIPQHRHARLDVFRTFNSEFLTGGRIEALDAVQEMYRADWPDTFQGEWPGFYLEHRLADFVERRDLRDIVELQKVKYGGGYDYDLAFKVGGDVAYYGDLKSSDVRAAVSPGNDAEDIRRCVSEYGRFWYVIYEHRTWHARDLGDQPTIAWNEWKRSVGYDNGKPYNPLSYARRFKAAVLYSRMKILEVNPANIGVVLTDFRQGKQPDGAARALKVMISKKNVDNFVVLSESLEV